MNARDKWLFSHALKSQQLLLLLYYDKHANGELACFPSFNTTAADCRLARRYVIDTTLKVLCAEGGPMSVVTDPADRAAILAKAGAKYNPRVNVYKINYSNGASRAPSDSARRAPSRPNSAPHAPTHSAPHAPSESSAARLEAEALAMCVPFGPEDSAPDAPSDSAHGAPGAPVMVHLKQVDGAPDDTGMVHGVHPILKIESKTEPTRAHGGARAREAAPVARTLTGAPGATRASVPQDDDGLPDRSTTIAGALGGAPDKAPSIEGNGATPANALRRPGAPPDPFAEWLDGGAPAARALGLAMPRPKTLYAPVGQLVAARADLARRAAGRGGP